MTKIRLVNTLTSLFLLSLFVSLSPSIAIARAAFQAPRAESESEQEQNSSSSGGAMGVCTTRRVRFTPVFTPVGVQALSYLHKLAVSRTGERGESALSSLSGKEHSARNGTGAPLLC